MKKPTESSVRRFFFTFTFCVYLLMLLQGSLFKYKSLTELLTSSEPFYHTYGLNLIPFADYGFRDIFLNCLMYFPLGFLISMKVAEKSGVRFISLYHSASVCCWKRCNMHFVSAWQTQPI